MFEEGRCTTLLLSFQFASQGKVAKYTEYSSVTAITKSQGQSTLMYQVEPWAKTGEDVSNWRSSLVVEKMMSELRLFVGERHWGFSHRPRNLMLAMISEVGELLDAMKWNGDEAVSLPETTIDSIGQEIGDIAIIWLRMADLYGPN
jgi:NTP pyrophosphatase (non-canonical NTP hydrolase)